MTSVFADRHIRCRRGPELRIRGLVHQIVFGAICLAVGAGWSLPAFAVTQFQKSLYTTIDRKTCTVLRQHPDGNAYRCKGLVGYPVYFAEGDGRAFVAASTDPEHSEAAAQTLEAFNTPFPHPGERATIEWRFVIRDKRQIPFAMIVRYFTEHEGEKGEVLVVTKIAEAQACHVAYVDAVANPDAIVLARRIADERARAFKCGDAASVIGAKGKSPM